jgi:ankyrin repeat protein
MILRRNIDIFEELLPYASQIINDGDNEGKTPFHYACIMNCNEILNLILKNKLVNKNQKSNIGFTALHYACYHHSVDGVKALLNSPSIIKDLLDEDNAHPLQQILSKYIFIAMDEKVSFLQSALVIFELMLDAGGEVYTKDRFGKSVLDQALF